MVPEAKTILFWGLQMQGANRADAAIFTEDDYECLYEAMNSLSEREIAVLIHRFWGLSTIEDISLHLRNSWSSVDRTLDETLKKLRTALLSNSNFTRTSIALAA